MTAGEENRAINAETGFNLDVTNVRQDFIDRLFVGFSANTRAVKPVHIANGFFRAITGRTFDTSLLNRFVYWQTSRGEVPRGHELDTLYEELRSTGKLIPEECSIEDVGSFRTLLRNIVNADGAVYSHKDRMESYTAGYKAFVSQDRVAQDGGEFAAQWLKVRGSPLIATVEQALESAGDPITALAYPLLSTQGEGVSPNPNFNVVKCLNEPLPETPSSLLDGLATAADTLNLHILAQPNKLVRLRLALSFVSLFLVRHMTLLEAYYVPGRENMIVPFLLDFSGDSASPIARASEHTFAIACQSIVRFYAWAYGLYLKRHYSAEELSLVTPHLGRRSKNRDDAQAREIWQTTLRQAIDADDPFTVLGQACYDILALQTEATPIDYLKQLGHRCGLLYPPSNRQPAKRFSPTHDFLEVLVRGAVRPGEILSLRELQTRFWQRYGMIVGGALEDEQRLIEAGVFQVDSDALSANRRNFALRLIELGFASELADGVLTVEVGGN